MLEPCPYTDQLCRGRDRCTVTPEELTRRYEAMLLDLPGNGRTPPNELRRRRMRRVGEAFVECAKAMPMLFQNGRRKTPQAVILTWASS